MFGAVGMSRGYVQRGGYPPTPTLGMECGIPRDTIGKQAVRILLECCLVLIFIHWLLTVTNRRPKKFPATVVSIKVLLA